MKVFLIRDGARRKCSVPFHGKTAADHVVVIGESCPHCKDKPFKVGGANMRVSTDDQAYESDAGCMSCKKPVGTFRAEMNTLFGVREDEAVLHGRARVY